MNGIQRTTRVALAVGTLACALTALLLAGPAGAGVERATATAKEFRNCTALNRVYPHGVGRVGARDRTSGTPVQELQAEQPALSPEQRSSDRDKDGVACEKA